ncbi:MAG TPA: glycosyltransferase family 4 protein [Chthonomonadaceae bacterium]|nr:glycosyltransferase family 4 protein [Chthonomonadaceae bacterium]
MTHAPEKTSSGPQRRETAPVVLTSVGPACKRILFFDHTANLGGGEIALLRLASRLDRTRYTPLVVLASDGPLVERLRAAGIETHVLSLSPRITQARKDGLGGRTLLRGRDLLATLAYIRQLARFIRQQQADIVHTNSLKADILGGCAARLARTPVIWHIHDRIAEDYLPASVARLFRWLCRVLPDYIVTNSQATLSTLRYPRQHRCAVIACGAEIRPQSEEGARKASAAETKPMERRIGLVGRISPWKGQHIFLHAAALVRRRFPAARFLVIGAALFAEKDYEAQIHALTHTLGLEDCVEFTGFRNDVPDLIASLEILVHASTIGEPFGQVIIEGMAEGKPVVATDGGAIPEIVEEGKTGLLVPMGDAVAMAEAIGALLSDPERAARMGQHGRERVLAHFTLDQMARRMEAIYDTLIRRTCQIEP